MAEMKDSGVAWVNKIPKEWALKKIKYTLKNRNENNNPIRCRKILSLTAKQGVIPLEEKEGGGNKPKEDYSAYKLAYPNDIVMNSMNVLSGSVGLSKYFGCVSPVYYMLRPINENDDVRYFNYIFQTTVFQRSLLGLGNGILMKESDNGKLNTIRMRIPIDKLGELLIPVPESSVQKKIADYLDNVILDIDILLVDIKKQLETLEEYKKSIITEVVTKGLDPNVKMKDSGIEWIGEIPNDWKITRIGYESWIRARLGWKGLKAEEYVPEGHPLLSALNIVENKISWSELNFINDERYNESPEIMLKVGDIILVKDGAGIGKCARIDNLPLGTATTNGSLVVISPSLEKLDYNYLYFYLQSAMFQNYINRIMNGMGVPHLSQEELRKIKIPCPSINMQIEIAGYLERKRIEIDSAILEKKQQLETLEQYKKSLIYEYVTGKKEVL